MTLIFKSIDTMKTSRDNNTTSNANKVAHINAIVANVPDCTHIAIGCYLNNYGYHSVAYIKEWFDAVHNAGKKVFFRPALAGEGITNTTTLNEKLTEGANLLSSAWANGDAWDVVPESNPNETGLYANIAAWNTWIRNLISELDTLFTTMGKTVEHTYFSGTDQTAIFNTKLEAETVTAMGNKICIDFYPMDYIGSPGVGTTLRKVKNCFDELATAHANYPTADLYITEIGYNNTTLVGDEDQREVVRHFLNELKNVSYIKGLNYWHASGNAEFDKCHLFVSQSLTSPRPALKQLSDFYTNGVCNKRMTVI